MQTPYHDDSAREYNFFVYPQDGIQVYKCQGHPHQCCQVNVTPGLVALRSKANNKYICADSNGSKPLIANRDAAAGWETFELVVINGDNVALKSKTNNLYISIGDDGKNILLAKSAEVGPTETFKIVDRGIGKVAFLAANGKYVCAENGGQGELVANRAKASVWETFDLVWK